MAEEDNPHKELRKLRAAAGQCKSAFTRFEKHLETVKEHPTDALLDVAHRRYKALEGQLEKYKEIQLQIHIFEETLEEEDFAEDELEDRYYILGAELARLTPRKSNSEDNGYNNLHANKLPNLEIPTFSGETITEFMPFIELFEAVIHSDPKLSAVQKLCYLKAHLTKEALSLIQGLPIVSSSYEASLALLRERYDNPCILIASHVNKMLDYPVMSSGTAAHLRELVSTVRQHISALKNLQQPVDAWDMLLLPILLRKIDKYTVRAFHMERNKEKHMIQNGPTFLHTKFGYIAGGNTNTNTLNPANLNNSTTSLLTKVTTAPDIDLETLMERFWEVEGYPVTSVPQVETPKEQQSEEEICENIFATTTTFENVANCDIWAEELQLLGHQVLEGAGRLQPRVPPGRRGTA